jgi:hypothetical protein
MYYQCFLGIFTVEFCDCQWVYYFAANADGGGAAFSMSVYYPQKFATSGCRQSEIWGCVCGLNVPYFLTRTLLHSDGQYCVPMIFLAFYCRIRRLSVGLLHAANPFRQRRRKRFAPCYAVAVWELGVRMNEYSGNLGTQRPAYLKSTGVTLRGGGDER